MEQGTWNKELGEAFWWWVARAVAGPSVEAQQFDEPVYAKKTGDG